jgi:hypothetical protein
MGKMKSIIIAALAMVAYATAQGPEVSGSLSQSFLYSNENDYLIPGSSEGSFELAEILLNIHQEINSDLRVGMQFISRDFGDEGNLGVELDWGYADYSPSEYFGLRVGRYKLPQGLYNEVRDLDIVRDEVLLPQSVYPEEVRGIVSGLNGVNWYGRIGPLEYQNYIGNMNINPEIRFVKFLGEIFNNKNTSLENRWTVGTSLTLWLLDDRFRMNYNFMNFAGFFNVGGDNVIIKDEVLNVPVGAIENVRKAYSLDVKVHILGIEIVGENWTLAAEGKLQNFENRATKNFIAGLSGALEALPDPDVTGLNSIDSILAFTEHNLLKSRLPLILAEPAIEEFWGWYIKGSYRLIDDFALTAGYGETALGQLSPDDYKNYQKDGYIGFNYNVGLNVSIKAEAHAVAGTYYAYPIDEAGVTEKFGQYYLLRGTYAF